MISRRKELHTQNAKANAKGALGGKEKQPSESRGSCLSWDCVTRRHGVGEKVKNRGSMHIRRVESFNKPRIQVLGAEEKGELTEVRRTLGLKR